MAGRAPRARDRAAAPPARRLCRRRRTSCSTTSGTTPAASTRTSSRTPTGWGTSRSLVVYHNRYGETSGWVRNSAAYAIKDDDGSRHLATRTLAEGLGLADGDAGNRWVAYREQRSSLEYLRSVADIRDQGLHLTLHAYETRIFWQVRELQDTSGIWRRLAERLGGRGVPSLEDALRELQLVPVHDAIRAAIEAPSREASARVVDAVAEATGTGQGEGAREAVVDAIVARAAPTELVAKGIADRSQAAALRVSGRCWHRSGRCPRARRSDRPAGPGTRSCAWRRSWPTGLRRRGLDEGAAWWAAERVRLLLDLPLPSSVRRTLPRCRSGSDVVAGASRRGAVPAGQPVGRRDVVPRGVARRAARLGPAPGIVAIPGPCPPPALAAIAAASAASAFRVDALRDALRVPGEEAEPAGCRAGASPAEPGADAIDAIEPGWRTGRARFSRAGSPAPGKPC